MGDERQRPALAAGVAIVLVVDHASRQRRIKATLAGEGFVVRYARSPAAALDRLLHEDVDVLLVDEDLLGPGGELVHRARLYDSLLPIIVQSGVLGLRERRCMMRELELHGIHQRDGDTSHLIELVESALVARRRGALSQASQELPDFIATRLGQDLLTALQVIRGYTEVLRSEPAPPATEEILERLERAGDDALAWAQDYLDLSHADALEASLSPETSLQYSRVDIDALLQDLQAFARQQIGARPVRFTVRAPASGACIYTDGERLDAVLSQLVADALKHTPAGDVQLAVRLQPESVDFVLIDARQSADDDQRVPGRALHGQAGASGGVMSDGVELATARRLSALLGASLTTQPAHPCGLIFTLRVPLSTLSSVPAGVTLH